MSEFRPKARRPRGFGDRRGVGLTAERAITDKVLAVYEAWGFERLETPALEYADALGKFLPDQDRPNEGVFSFQDDDEQWLSLRYDLTAPLARFVAENYDALPKPYRRCAAGPVWRNEKPGPGRFREFWQCDADTVGSASPAADAEMIAMACAALEAVGVAKGRYKVAVSDRRLLDGLLETLGLTHDVSKKMRVMRAIDKWDRLGEAGVRLLLGRGRKDESGDFTEGADLGAAQIDSVVEYVGADIGFAGSPYNKVTMLASLPLAKTEPGQNAIKSLFQVVETLRNLGLGTGEYQVDTSVVRGLEYYTGTVFEALLVAPDDQRESFANFGSVGGGGRYDDLVSRFKGQPIPATGFSIGVSRLAAALGAAEAAATGPIVVLALDATQIGESFAIAARLRAEGFVAETYLGSSGMKAQMKYADKRGAPLAVIVGEDERARGVAAVKDLRAGSKAAAGAEDREAWAKTREQVQHEAPLAELPALVRRLMHPDA